MPRDDRAPERPVFQGFGADKFRTALTRACTAAGVPVFSPHDLRHRRVSLLHLGGMPWALTGGGKDSQIYLAVLLELLLIISNIGTAVVPFPIFRRQNEPLAVGYVTARVIECTFIAAGIIFALGVVSLRQDSPNAADLAVSLAALKDWTFQLGPNWIVGWGNGLILGYLMYRSGLVPRRMAWFGLIGGPLIILSGTGVIFGWWCIGSPPQGLFDDPGVHLGTLPRDLLHHLGVQARCSHPEE